MVYTIFLAFHNIIRWLALAAGLISVTRSWNGLLEKKIREKKDRLAVKTFVIAMDVQFLLGIILYFALSPLTKKAFSNMAEAMKDTELRFFVAEHFILMLAAVILVHIGSAKIKRAATDEAGFKYGSIFFSIAMVLIVAGMPWARRLLPF